VIPHWRNSAIIFISVASFRDDRIAAITADLFAFVKMSATAK
jgi:hypothetical protein